MNEQFQKDIAFAVSIEDNVPEDKWDTYLDCMNGKPMAERKTERELRDGCILINHVWRVINK